jgi:hypothetical protein
MAARRGAPAKAEKEPEGVEWAEDTEENVALKAKANRAIDNFSSLISSRLEAWKEKRAAGDSVVFTANKPTVGFTKTMVMSKEYALFHGAYDPVKEKPVGVIRERMWPIRNPEHMPAPKKWPLSKNPDYELNAARDDATALLSDVGSAVKNDEELLKELAHLRNEIVGMYEFKARLISTLLSALTGGMRASATGMNFVFGGNPGTGKTSIAPVVGKIITLMGWIERTPSRHPIVIELRKSIEHYEPKRAEFGAAAEGPASPRSRRFLESEQRRRIIEREEAERTYGIVPEDRNEYASVRSRENLVAAYQGMTALRTLQTIVDDLGKFVLYDEAYGIIEGADDAYGTEVVNVLISWIPRIGQDRLAVFAVAGYVDLLQENFFRGNEGLQTRFPLVFVLPDYTPVQIAFLFHRFMLRGGWKLDFPSTRVEALISRMARDVEEEVERKEEEAASRRIVRTGAARPEAKKKKAKREVEEGEEPKVTRWTTRSTIGGDGRTGVERALVAFFVVFQRVFEIGNVRKAQNFIGLIEEKWASAMISDDAPKTLAWLESLRTAKKVDLDLMMDAMEVLLTSSIGFEPPIETNDAKSEEDLF